ncbi:2,3-bisphosphoglycerate-independent phosphoglycerate mutase [Roseiterribacter gracilis]|uniref:2,3-bisphosphoglycerate-independent phosphoglycerate mutase n=1 Tax=Roseiterribacter gracilis TaxID=2812848 RepID=A0A8S8XA17_9PROT|nr:2,3-bisphosphoglycerate-independent phosphoglycerate mutase [Rhodospirillales bacterium TMPK1]
MTDKKPPRPVVLCILDGFGWREETADNAVAQAKKPNFDRLWAKGPRAFLQASEEDVGLPHGQIGNSEVGHTNLGAGRVVLQELPRLDKALKEGDFARNPALTGLLAKLKQSGGTCQLMGLVSPGGVHSHQSHVLGLAQAVSEAGVPVVVHVWTDGRDVPPQSAAEQVRWFATELAKLKNARIGTVIGRYYAMDRDKRWERVQAAYDAMVDAKGVTTAPDAVTAIEQAYKDKVTDEFVPATVIGDYKGMQDGDGILCANFRADRVRQTLAALLDAKFEGFARHRAIKFVGATGVAEYSEALNKLVATMYPPQSLTHVLGQLVADAGLRQLRAAETEKYPHVTFFFNGGREEPYAGEDRIMVPSPKVATYDLQPEMSAAELTDKVAAAIDTGQYDLVVMNYANPDMVGHTGSLSAAIKAVEAVDAGLGKIVASVERQGGAMLVTADHGNCELMLDPETGGPHTAHTLNKVPIVLVDAPAGVVGMNNGRLADIAPTLLALMQQPQPPEMTGHSLLSRQT